MPSPIAEALVALKLDTRSINADLDRAIRGAVAAAKTDIDIRPLVDPRGFTEISQRSASTASGVATDFEVAGERAEDAIGEVGDKSQREFQRVERQAADASDKTSRSFRGAATAISTALVALGAIEFGKRAIEQAADLGESINAVNVVIGEGADSFIQFGETAADQLGIAQSALNEAIVPLASLLKNAGLSGLELSDRLEEVSVRATDVASVFNKDVNEVLTAFASAVRGETEPIRALGVNFDEAALQAKALELGLADTTKEVTQQDKALAALELILEQTASASGDFANTADSLPNLLRRVKASGLELAGSIGQTLLPSVIGIAQQLVPAFEELQPAFASLGGAVANIAESLIPPLISALSTLTPAASEFIDVFGETFADALDALAPLLPAISQALGNILSAITPLIPIIGIFAEIIGAIPPELITLIVTFGGLQRILAPVGTALTGLASTFAANSAAIGLINPAIAAAGAALAVFSVISGQNAERERRREERTRQATAALDDLTRSVEDSTAAFLEQALTSQDFLDFINEADISFNDLAETIAQGPEAVDALQSSFADLVASQGAGLLDAALFGAQLEAQTKAINEAAKAQIAGAIATEKLSQGQVDAAIAANTAEDGSINYAGALEILRGELDKASQEQAEAAEKSRELAEALSLEEQAALELSANIASAFAEISASINEFVTTAAGSLPAVADAFSNVGEDSILSAAEFIAALETQTTALATFRTNLTTLTAAGFADLAAVIAEQGPEVGAALATELATAIEAGNVEIVQGVQDATAAFETEWESTTAFFRDVLGPQFILQALLTGGGAAAAFGQNLTFEERVRIAGQLAQTQLDAQGQAIAAIAATEGASAAQAYGDTLDLDQKTIDAAIAAGEAIRNNAPIDAASSAGHDIGLALGEGASRGVRAAQAALNAELRELVRQGLLTAKEAAHIRSPSQLFAEEIGLPIAEGIALGIDQGAAALAGSVSGAIDAASIQPALTAVPSLSAGAGNITIGPVSIQVFMAPGADPAVVGRGIGDGFLDQLQRRNARLKARIA